MSNITKPSGQVPGNLMVSMPRPAPAKPRSDPPSASEEERRLVPRGEPEELPRPGPEEAVHHFCLVPQRKHVYSALPDAKAIANVSLLRVEPNLLRIANGDDDNDHPHDDDG